MFQVKDKQTFKDTINIFLKAYDTDHLLPLLPTPPDLLFPFKEIEIDTNFSTNCSGLSSFVSTSNCTLSNIYAEFCLTGNAHYLLNLVTKELFTCTIYSIHWTAYRWVFVLSFTVAPLKDQIVRKLRRTRHVV